MAWVIVCLYLFEGVIDNKMIEVISMELDCPTSLSLSLSDLLCSALRRQGRLFWFSTTCLNLHTTWVGSE